MTLLTWIWELYGVGVETSVYFFPVSQLELFFRLSQLRLYVYFFPRFPRLFLRLGHPCVACQLFRLGPFFGRALVSLLDASYVVFCGCCEVLFADDAPMAPRVEPPQVFTGSC